MQLLDESSNVNLNQHQTPPLRAVDRVVPARSQLEGGGFEVYRPFPSRNLNRLDPFLLLDEMAPNYVEPGEAVGAPDHPHRGFETVTYVLQGEVEHRDSAGNHGIIGPGDVQWMTAGDGIVHSEMPSERVQTEGGMSHGLQLWVNLPAELRRTTPRYQALPTGQITKTGGSDWRAEVIAGELFGVAGPAETHTPVGLARLTLEPGASIDIDVADGYTAAVYVFDGQGKAGSEAVPVGAHELLVFERATGAMRIVADIEQHLDVLVLVGEPIGEPIARYGPFVMNTMAEIEEAFADYQAGRMGTIPAVGSV